MPEETVHVTASRWWQRRKGELAPNTRLDYRWRMDRVLRHLAHDTTAELDAHRVDTFRRVLEGAERAFLATLCLAGPRISELTQTTVGRLDLEAGGLELGLKTAAGIDRHLELRAFVVEELRVHVESLPAALRERYSPALPLFPTCTGGQLNPSNIRNRLLAGTPAREGKGPIKGVVERANEQRAAQGRMLLPTTVTPHTLRRGSQASASSPAGTSGG